MRNTWLSSFLVVGLVAAFSNVASAGIDGIIGAGEYDHQWTVQGWDGSNVVGAMPTATLYMHQDASNNLYVALVLPKTYADNSYGGSGYTSAGWTSAGKNHNFSDLTGSDHAEFLLKKNTNTAFFDGNMDYLSQNGSAYGSLGFVGGDGGLTATAGATVAQQTAMVADAESAMGYNYLNGGMGALYTTHSPTLATNVLGNPTSTTNPNWVYDVVYEYEILAGATGSFGNNVILGGSGASSFVTNGFGFELTFVHASPNMYGSNSYGYRIVLTPQGTPAVPLPAAAWMGGLTMLGIAAEALRRRRRNALLA